MPLLDPARLPPLMGDLSSRFDVDSVDCVTSTNSVLAERLASRRATSGSVLVADTQTAGRGRQGRAWVSEAAQSLTFSLALTLKRSPHEMGGFSLAVGLSIFRALQTLGATELGLKWPNDVLWRSPEGSWGKLAGILIELTPRRGEVEAIVGIGLNLEALEGVRLGEGAQGIADLHSALPAGALAPDRHTVLAALLSALHSVRLVFETGGFAALRNEWEAAHAWTNAWVQVSTGEVGRELLSGQMIGVSEDGALLLKTAAGVMPVLAGDVSLRLLPEEA